MLIQIVIRLILYTDQYILRKGSTESNESGSYSSSSDATDDGGGTAKNISVHDTADTTNGETNIIRGIDNTVRHLFLFLNSISC